MTSFARKLEPHRGFHSLMRSRPPLPQLSPQSLVLVVDGDAVSEGVRLSQGQSYRARPMAELGDRIDWTGVVCTGRLPYAQYLKVLQV